MLLVPVSTWGKLSVIVSNIRLYIKWEFIDVVDNASIQVMRLFYLIELQIVIKPYVKVKTV